MLEIAKHVPVGGTLDETSSVPILAGLSPRQATGLVLVFGLLFIAFGWNRVFPVTSGNELFLADQLAAGRLPYRDFYMAVPPALPLMYRAITLTFGRSVAAFFVVFLLIRLAAIVLCTLWLSRLLPAGSVALAAVVGFVAAAGDIAEAPDLYHHLIPALAIASAWLLDRAISPSATHRHSLVLAAGVLLGVSSMIKETSGPLAVLILTPWFLYCGWRLFGPRRAVGLVSLLLLGVALPIAAIGIWLASHSALLPFIDQTLLVGPGSKGGLTGSIWRIAFISINQLRRPLLVGIGVVALIPMSVRWKASTTAGWFVVLFLLMALLPRGSWRLPQLAACYVAFGGSGMVAAIYGQRFRLSGDSCDARLALAGLLCFSTAFGLALSWPAYEPMILPGFVLVGGVLGEALRKHRHRLCTLAGVTGLLVLLTTSLIRRVVTPFGWGGWHEAPLFSQRGPTTLPELRGLALSRRTATLLESTVQAVRSRRRSGDKMLVFPLMADLYSLTGLEPATYAHSHYIDICPDDLADRDLETIRDRPPAFIIVQFATQSQLRTLEYAFRGGRASGEREMQDGIKRLLEDDGYRRVDAVYMPGAEPVEVWARPDRSDQHGRTVPLELPV